MEGFRAVHDYLISMNMWGMTLDFLKTLEAVKANFKKLDMMIRILSDRIVTGNSILQNFLMKYAG